MFHSTPYKFIWLSTHNNIPCIQYFHYDKKTRTKSLRSTTLSLRSTARKAPGNVNCGLDVSWSTHPHLPDQAHMGNVTGKVNATINATQTRPISILHSTFNAMKITTAASPCPKHMSCWNFTSNAQFWYIAAGINAEHYARHLSHCMKWFAGTTF